MKRDARCRSDHDLSTIVLLGLCAVLTFLSQTQPANGQLSLEIPPDARTEAMGRAFSVLDRGASSAWGNVGGLAFVSGFEVSGSRAGLYPDLYADITYLFGSAVYGFNLAGKGIALNVNAARLRFPPQTYHCTSDYNDAVLGGAIAFRLNSFLGAGMGVKRVRQSYSGGMGEGLGFCDHDEVLDSGPAIDLGMLGFIPVLRDSDGKASLDILGGLSVRNLGPDLHFPGDESTPLPWHVVTGIGGAWRSEPASASSIRWLAPPGTPLLSISAGGSVSMSTLRREVFGIYEPSYYEKRLTDGQWGGELRLLDILSLRGGYLNDAVNDAHGATWGAGIAVRNVAGFDFASIPQRDELQRVTKILFRVGLRNDSGESP